MSNISSKVVTGGKYIYLVIFFALLSGFFYPLITGAPADSLIFGTFILFVGLAGGVLLFKAATSDKKSGIYMGGGFVFIAISLYYILTLTGRI